MNDLYHPFFFFVRLQLVAVVLILAKDSADTSVQPMKMNYSVMRLFTNAILFRYQYLSDNSHTNIRLYLTHLICLKNIVHLNSAYRHHESLKKASRSPIHT